MLELLQFLNAAQTGMSVFGQIEKGKQSRAAAEFEAAQLRQNAGQALAASQREALTVDEQTKRIASRALAVAASSGGGASDPTVVHIMAGIASEGAYRSALALYKGEDEARGLNMQADATIHSGKQAQRSAYRSALGSAIGGIARGKSLFEKYGSQGGPGSPGWGKDLGVD